MAYQISAVQRDRGWLLHAHGQPVAEVGRLDHDADRAVREYLRLAGFADWFTAELRYDVSRAGVPTG